MNRAIILVSAFTCYGITAAPGWGSEQQVSEECVHVETSLPFSSETSLGFSGDDAVRNLFRNAVASLTWTNEMPGIENGQHSTQASFNFVQTSDFVTVVSEKEDHCWLPSARLIIDGNFEAKSDDGKLNVRCPIKLEAQSIGSGFVHTTPFINDGWYRCEELNNLAGPARENQMGILLRLSINDSWINGSIIRQYIDETGWHNDLVGTIW